MKKAISICSVLCGATALLSLVMGITVIMGKGRFMSLALFSMAKSGTFTGFIGNLVGIVITCGGFGLMCLYGLTINKPSSQKNAFIYGGVMTVICAVSLVFSIVNGSFNFGDVVMLALPGLYTFSVFRSA